MTGQDASKEELLAELARLQRKLAVQESVSGSFGGSQAWLHAAILNEIQDHVTVTDLNGIIVYVNPIELTTLKRSAADLIGKSIDIYGDDPARGATQREIIDHVRNHGEWRGEVVNFAADGAEIYFDCHVRIMHDAAGQPQYLCGISRDITDRKRAELTLRASEERYRNLFTGIRDAILVTDMERRICQCNPAVQTLFGYNQEELIGRLTLMLHADEQEYLLLGEALDHHRNDPSFLATIHFRKKNGAVFTGETCFFFLEDASSGATQVVGVVRDISEREQAARLLEDAYANNQHILDSISEAFFSLDATLRIAYFNTAAEKVFNKRREEVIGEYLYACLPQFRGSIFDNTIQRVLRESRPICFETYFQSPPYANWYEARISPHAAGISVYLQVITERKRAEEGMQRRLMALTQPMDHADALAFEDLFDLEEVQRIQDTFAKATGVASIITRPDGSPLTRPSQFCRLCNDIIRGTEKGLQNCYCSDAAIGKYNPDGPIVQTCLSGGLWDAGASISVGGRHVANWLIGQVKNEAQDEDRMLRYAEEIGANMDDYRAALAEVPRMSLERFNNVARAVYLLANTISERAFQNVQQARFIAELKHAERTLVEERDLLQALLDNIPDTIYFKDLEGRFLRINKAQAAMLGIAAPEEALGKTDFDYFDADHARIAHEDEQRIITTGIPIIGKEEHHYSDGGGWKWMSSTKVPIYSNAGAITGLVGVSRDITAIKQSEEEHLRLEQQIQQTQKLESLGVLAGGIAHDFNNILMAVLGHAELALEELAPMSPARDSIRQIETAARRAADLCRQMLAYAGRSSFSFEKVHVQELVEEMTHLLKTSISKKAILNLHIERNLPPIWADPSQLRQIVMNLIVNASEAIGDRSGVISITVGAAYCDGEYLQNTYLDNALQPGLFIYLEVADTGCGMDAVTQARIFEPFFSTKFTGRGLGMAAVMGIVRGHGGALKVYSEPGKGTTFKVLFPAIEETESHRDRPQGEQSTSWLGNGCVLLVDDEETLRAIGRKTLERLGFSVLVACDGREAVEIYAQHGAEITLVLLDLTMPHMDGAETFRELRRMNPEVRVVLISGYSEQDVAARFAGKGLSAVIQKPYRLSRLREVLQQVLSETDNEM